uniref:TIR domain-containing protein n=1 Tax=Neogobius melanostomus TaxID=47308 RepID=A0A8C6S9T1_9GOBI
MILRLLCKMGHQKSRLKHLIIFLLFTIDCFVVQGFTLRSCRISGNKAICSPSKKLKEVPTDIPPTVESIDLSNNKILKLQEGNFIDFPYLTNLDLKQNKITKIGKGTFSRLFSLKTLNLNNNTLENLDDGVFDGLSNLTELRISTNRIETVAPDAFRSLTNLEIFVFSFNQLRTSKQIGLIIKHMPHLTQLHLHHNHIQTFNSSDLTNKPTGITLLDISGNPIKLFQITTNVFPNLTNLNVGNPPMTVAMIWDVPDKAMLAKVDTLDVSRVTMGGSAKMWDLLSTFNTSLVTLTINSMHYNLRTLINKSCSIPTVSTLKLGQNNLFYISSSLFEICTNVTEIVLSKCGIKRIADESFRPVLRLRTLRLDRNKLQTVPSAISNLRSLNKLDLSNNSIESLGCNDFANLTLLQYLSLPWNKITTLSACVFQHLPKLRVLQLQGNSLSNISNAFTTHLPNLNLLRLNQNSLTTLENGTFRGLPSLQHLFLMFAGLGNLLELKLQDNNIDRKIFQTFQDLVNLQNLTLANNHINYRRFTPMKHPPFMNLSKLNYLNLQSQHRRGKSKLPSNFLQGLTNLSTLILRNMQLTGIPEEFFIHMPNLDSLDLNSNDLMDISPNLFSPIPNITKLRISDINLRSLDFLTEANLTKLKFLQARKNAFPVISEEIIRSMPSLRYIDLEFSSFICDCDSADFIKWIKKSNQTQVFNAYNFKCYYPSNQKNKMLLDLNVQSCMIDIGFICFTFTTCVNLLFLVASLTYHFMRFQLAYAYYIFLAWLYDRKNKSSQAPSQYDAFVSYNVHDEAWVYRELVPRLEKQQGWKLCLHHRDFEPGKRRPIVDNITDAIYGSRKTLCVISRRYLQSEWCSREMQVASFRLFDESKDVLILVFLEDIPSCHLSPYYRMRRVLKRQTYLSWPGEGPEVHVFWEKLRQALTTKKCAAEERLLLTVTDEQ